MLGASNFQLCRVPKFPCTHFPGSWAPPPRTLRTTCRKSRESGTKRESPSWSGVVGGVASATHRRGKEGVGHGTPALPRKYPRVLRSTLGGGKGPGQGKSGTRGCRAPERSDGGARAKAYGESGASGAAGQGRGSRRRRAEPVGLPGGGGRAGAERAAPGRRGRGRCLPELRRRCSHLVD